MSDLVENPEDKFSLLLGSYETITNKRSDVVNAYLYNAITHNNREIDRVNKKELYMPTVSIKLFLLTV